MHPLLPATSGTNAQKRVPAAAQHDHGRRQRGYGDQSDRRRFGINAPVCPALLKQATHSSIEIPALEACPPGNEPAATQAR